jgi:hypothetical protein
METMDIALEAEIYYPILNDERNYVDKVPSNITHGIRCPCGTKKDKVYYTHGTFYAHAKTKRHIAWLNELNLNQINHLRENEELKKTVTNQKLIILQLEKENVNNLRTINYLTQQLMKLTTINDTVVTNLLDV